MKKNKGFSLIELLAVMVILGILLSVTVVAVKNIKTKQEEKNRKNVISSILTGAKEYIADHPEVSSPIIDVGDLLTKYVDFDQNKYSDLANKTVEKKTCTNNDLKRMFLINDGNTTYNDCGCELQDDAEVSNELCVDDLSPLN